MAFPHASVYQPDMLPMQQKTEKQLECELQLLLDAQGEGLVAGLDLSGGNDTASEDDGSRSMRASSRGALSSGSRGKKRKLRLNEARLGILGTMRELAMLKDGKVAGLQMRVAEAHEIASQLEDWDDRRDRLQEEIGSIQKSQDARQLEELEQDECKAKQEIHELETRLYQLRAKQRHLASEIARVKNSVEAKMSSYQASLSILDKQIQDFLSNPPGARSRHAATSKPSSFMSLPSGRRTLAMARQYWKDEGELLNTTLDRVEFERDALDDGAHVWEDVIAEVGRFETGLRKELRRYDPHSSRLVSNATMFKARDAANGAENVDDGMTSQQQAITTTLMSEMDRTMALLESKLRLAEARNWNLLVCCIGAELEAFQEGKEVIASALPQPAKTSSSPSSSSSPTLRHENVVHHHHQVGKDEDDDDDKGHHPLSRRMDGLSLNAIGHLARTRDGEGEVAEASMGDDERSRREARHDDSKDGDDDDEDLGPGPDLLVSHEH